MPRTIQEMISEAEAFCERWPTMTQHDDEIHGIWFTEDGTDMRLTLRASELSQIIAIAKAALSPMFRRNDDA
jgi:hypothetical protein